MMSRKLGLLERLSQGIVLGAEGYVFELERRGYIQAGAYVPEVVLDYPEAVKELHRELLRAGAEVMVALTYYAHRKKLRTIGREGELEELNRFQALKDVNGQRGFPIALDPFQATRFEMADFAARAEKVGVNYIGTCCGAAPHHVRAMAEALGRTVPASRYSPDMSLHPMLGSSVRDADQEFLAGWKD
jgi:methionine synthase I (cobalamin-dependent)